mmetsp:Transcript_114222/g.333977  ORF Transcript_114222/g.333977 Transcript_114222/m.333977 type:complete len:418 (+) Transcript_114222:1569-2822(+)
MLLPNPLLKGLTEFAHLPSPCRHHALAPGLLLLLPDALHGGPELVLLAQIFELVVHGHVHLESRNPVQAIVGVALTLLPVVAGVLLPTVQRARVDVLVLVLQRLHALLAALEELRLVLSFLRSDEAHLLAELLLLLPLHGLLRLPLLVAPALVYLFRELLLELLLCHIRLVATDRRAATFAGTGTLVQEVSYGIVDVLCNCARSIGSSGGLGVGAVHCARRVASLALLRRCPLRFLPFTHDPHSPLQEQGEILLPENLEVSTELSDLVGGQGVILETLGARRFQIDQVVGHEDRSRVVRCDELLRADNLVVITWLVSTSVSLALCLEIVSQGCGRLLVCDTGLSDGIDGLHEDPLGIEEAGVYLAGLELHAQDEDLRGDIAGCRGLRGLNFVEELVEDPEQGVVVCRTEDLCDEGAP